ncbi:MAG: DNA-processing protein DprA [Planctomycetota bacterium]
MERPIVRIERGDAIWPAELDHVEGPPSVVWARGDLDALSPRPRVAIVGTRAPTPYGTAQAERFASVFARAGACIVSGLARGIDSAAHEAALDVGGSTVAVLACGVDRPWPTGALADAMGDRGLLLSEFEPGTPPSKSRFPLRNRLIAGLCSAVVVIEAAYRSGSLITARWAADQGQEVWALPGRVDQPMARGCHRLLREGARLAESPDEVLESLGLETAADEPSETTVGHASHPLIEALVGETPSAEQLAQAVDWPLPRVLAELARLELEGRLARAPGGLGRRDRGAGTDEDESASRHVAQGGRVVRVGQEGRHQHDGNRPGHEQQEVGAEVDHAETSFFFAWVNFRSSTGSRPSNCARPQP